MTAHSNAAVTFGPTESPESLASVSAVLHGSDMPALVGPDGAQIPLPHAVFEALKDVVDAMQQGKGITIIPRDARLTTQQAAEFLGLSRPTVVSLLESGKIPFEKPGRHRRVKLADIVEFQERQLRERRESLDEITRLASEDPPAPTFITTR